MIITIPEVETVEDSEHQFVNEHTATPREPRNQLTLSGHHIASTYLQLKVFHLTFEENRQQQRTKEEEPSNL